MSNYALKIQCDGCKLERETWKSKKNGKND